MTQENPKQRLSRISTQWSLVGRANQGPAEAANAARQELLKRYGDAVRRYLRKILHDPDAADEVFQEFALRLLHGNLHGAKPSHGRFRNFVKGTLFHLTADYHKQRRKWPAALPDDGASLATVAIDMESDRLFVESWCDELLARAWAALAEIEAATGQPFYAVLRFRADHPEMRSPQLAKELAVQLGRLLSPPGIRQILHRAREKFAALLLDDVTYSLENPTPAELEEELAELGLLEYCRPVLERRSKSVTA